MQIQHEQISVFDILKVGIGPSSSHTLAPWRAAQMFLNKLEAEMLLTAVSEVSVRLYGSLAKTGKGHGTDVAIMLGLSGHDPVSISTANIFDLIATINLEKQLFLNGKYPVPFVQKENIVFEKVTFPLKHPNTMTFVAYSENKEMVLSETTYYSVGGGFVEEEGMGITDLGQEVAHLPYPVDNASDLLKWCAQHEMKISRLVLENEKMWRDEKEVTGSIQGIWDTMASCVYKGCHSEGILKGGLNVRRRAANFNKTLMEGATYASYEEWLQNIQNGGGSFKYILDWVSCFALAVNEENASFGRVVTAPTNGAAGVIPAVLLYYVLFCEGAGPDKIREFLFTAAQIGILFKKGATISAAMGGCQAEIGVSSAMAAAGLTEVLGGTCEQCLMAAEIAIEHHLGLTCDPVAGLVQIPCIERNAMGAIKAITASQLALRSNPSEAKVTLDEAVRTMWETAQDMNQKYKETSEGGLALNIPVPVSVSEC